LTDAQPTPRLPAGGGAGLSDAARPTPSAGRVAPRLLGYLGLLPFVLFVALFLFWPTVVVVVGAFQDADGHATLQNLAAAVRDANLSSFVWSIVLSATTALLGAVIGGLLAWAVATGRPDSLLRRAVLAASGTLAQFGGVMLAFGFLATFGFNGLVTLFLHDRLGIDPFASGA